MSASRLRAFAINAESIARLMPKFASKRLMTAGEAAHLARQLQTGAEAALSIAVEIERGNSDDIDEQKLRAATAAMLNSPAWPAVFQAGSAEVLARAAIGAALNMQRPRGENE